MKIKVRLTLAFSALISAVLTVFMIVCHYKYVDIETIPTYSGIGSREILLVNSSPFVTCFTVCCTVALLFVILVPALTFPKCEISVISPSNAFVIFTSSLLGFMFAGYVVNMIIQPLRNLWSTVKMPAADISGNGSVMKIIYYAGVVFAIPCACYFIMIALKSKLCPGIATGFLSLCPPIWLSLRLVYYFMSTSAQVNVAGRKLFVLALVLSVFFFLKEAKLTIPNSSEKSSKKEIIKFSKSYFATGFGAIIALSVSQITTTFLQAFWIKSPEDSFILNGIFITMALYIASRIGAVSCNEISKK